MSDILLGPDFQIIPCANGDAQLTDDTELLLQELRMEAVTQAGDLFYDEGYGWSLQDFSQKQADELTLLELRQRVEKKLARRGGIDVRMTTVSVQPQEDSILINVRFRFLNRDEEHELDLSVGRVQIEVIRLD